MTTTNLGMTIPTVGADADAWGNYLNTNLGLIDAAFTANRYTNFGGMSSWSPTSFAAIMGGYGSAWAITPVRTIVRLKICGTFGAGNVDQSTSLYFRYGTGTAPTQGTTASTSGTLIATNPLVYQCGAVGSSNPSSAFSFEAIITGLTPATAIWVDAAIAVTGSTGLFRPSSAILEEIR
jgi:hypothetical protein